MISWEQLAEKAYNSYMITLSKGSFQGTYGALYPETKLAWVEVVKTIYDIANEQSRDMLVESICKVGF